MQHALRLSFFVTAIFCADGVALADGTPLNSPYISSAILAGLPTFDPKHAGGNGAEQNGDQKPFFASGEVPALEIVRLPTFVVNGLKNLPSDEEILTDKGKGEIAMNDYLGDANGFDRGFLNRVTVSQLWQKIPVLGLIPFGIGGAMSNRERAMQISQRAKMAELKDLIAIGTRRGDPAVKKEQQEINKAAESIGTPP